MPLEPVRGGEDAGCAECLGLLTNCSPAGVRERQLRLQHPAPGYETSQQRAFRELSQGFAFHASSLSGSSRSKAIRARVGREASTTVPHNHHLVRSGQWSVMGNCPGKREMQPDHATTKCADLAMKRSASSPATLLKIQKVVDQAEDDPYVNPFLNKFVLRTQGGGIYRGSGLGAPKVTMVPAHT